MNEFLRASSLALLLCGGLGQAALAQSELTPGPERATEAEGPVNPYQGDANALQEGSRLFDWYNCSGCHAPQGAGGMGPPLSDAAWIYGDTPAALFNSIWEGRPAGMPTWANRIPPDEIWKIITYIEALPVANPAWGDR